MRQLELVALRALARANGLQRIVRSPLGGPRLGMASFGVRHRKLVSRVSDGCYACVLRFAALDLAKHVQARIHPGVLARTNLAIAVDAAGNIIIAGHTASADFAVPDSAFQTGRQGDEDGLVAILNPDGDLIGATYYSEDSYTRIQGLSVNSAGRIYIAGYSLGDHGGPAAFVTAFDPNLTRIGFRQVFDGGVAASALHASSEDP